MTKTVTANGNRRSKALSPDLLEVLHMLSALEGKPGNLQTPAAKE